MNDGKEVEPQRTQRNTEEQQKEDSLFPPWVSWLALGGVAALAGYAIVTSLVLPGIDPCYLPPGTIADGMVRASVVVWADANGNGIKEAHEPPLEGVRFTVGGDSGLTDAEGRGSAGVFKPGCPCRCWEHESVGIKPPDGYRPTTPTDVSLLGDDLTYYFGLAPTR